MREKKNSMLHAINAANNKIMNGKHPELGNKTFAEAIGQGGGGTGDYNDLKNKPIWTEEGAPGLNYCQVAEKIYKTIEFKNEEYSFLDGELVLFKLTPETVTIENRIVVSAGGQEMYCDSVGIEDVTIDGVDAKLKLYFNDDAGLFVEFVDSSEYNGLYMILTADAEDNIDSMLEIVQISSKAVTCKVNPAYKELFNEQPSPFIYTGKQYVLGNMNLEADARCGYCTVVLDSEQYDAGYVRASFRIDSWLNNPKIFCKIDNRTEDKPYIDAVFSRIKDTEFIGELSHIDLNGTGASLSELDYIDGKDTRLTCLKEGGGLLDPEFCLVDFRNDIYVAVYFVFSSYEGAELFKDEFHENKIKVILADEVNAEGPKLALGTADFYNAMYAGTDFGKVIG